MYNLWVALKLLFLFLHMYGLVATVFATDGEPCGKPDLIRFILTHVIVSYLVCASCFNLHQVTFARTKAHHFPAVKFYETPQLFHADRP